jgi:tol-pal system protein YbgF
VTRGAARPCILGVLALAGCATRAELTQQDHQLRTLVQEQRRQLQQVQKEIERLRAEVEEGQGSGGGGGRGAADDRLAALEQRIAQLEAAGGGGPPVEAERPEPSVAPREMAAVTPPAPPPPADEPWRRDVGREQGAAGAVNVPERAEYLAILDGLARKECAKSVPALNSFAGKYKESPLADNALYWVARCHEQNRDQNQAISKYYEVVTRFPKSDKAAAALWAQGNLFLQMGNTPDARIVLGKLIRDHPASEEAALARQRLGELQN